MSISSPSSCALLSTKPRASTPPTSTSLYLKLSSAPFSLPIRSPIARRCPCLVLCSSTVRTVAEMVEDKPSTSPAVATSSAASENNEQLGVHSRTFLDIRTEQDLLLGIQKELEAGRLPLNIAQSMEELYQNYRNAVFQSGHPQANDIVLSNMGFTLDRIFLDVKDPYDFSPYHEAIREPFDYYTFGQNYIRPLIDFRNSYVGNLDIFYEIEEKLKQGENVILISNHQTEADPAVLALLLEARIPLISESTTYVAGDRVVTDPLCKPFSKGRNLLCVYSKKHMNDDPELVEMKKRANTRSLKEMATLLRGGSMLIWISPSGGRDRPDPVTNEWFPSVVLKAFAAKKEGQSLESQFKAPFEASAVDNMRRLVVHAGIPGHIYPLALLCHDIMPPPAQVEKEIGEKRLIGFHGTGISVAPSISYNEITAACGDPEEAKVTYSRALCDSANEQYDVLKNAIHGKKGLEASTPAVSLSQPWV